jgi:hypothetical protein
MAEEDRPTGISYEDAIETARHGGTMAFEGGQVRVVDLSNKAGMFEARSARIELDLGDEYLVLFGYFSRDNKFMETGREHPFREDA